MDEAEKAIGGCFTVIAVIAVVTLVLAFPVMWLWNALCPELFHLPEITFWQALGLNMLCSILFKSPPVQTPS